MKKQDRFRGGLLVPITSSVQRGKGRISLYWHRLRGRLVAQTETGTIREYGRFHEQEVASTKGDVFVSNGSRFLRLGVGSNNHVLTADSGETTGVKWAASGGGGGASAIADPFADFWLVELWISGSNETGELGVLGWQWKNIGTGSLDWITPSAATEIGIIELTGNGTGSSGTGRGRVMYLDNNSKENFYRTLPTGMKFGVKCRQSGTTHTGTFWAGLASTYNTYPDEGGAKTCSFIGIRAADEDGSGTPNYFLVVRDGTSESTQDLGIASDGTFRRPGFRKTASGVIGTVDGSDVGSEITSNLPTVDIAPVCGYVTHGATNTVEIDTWAMWGIGLSL